MANIGNGNFAALSKSMKKDHQLCISGNRYVYKVHGCMSTDETIRALSLLFNRYGIN